MKPAIVLIAYNRPDALNRLLQSLTEAEYACDDITLVISIDNSGSEACQKTADDYEWTHGNKRIISHDTRMGLKKHILSCGDLVNEYGSIIMLEDDLCVSAYFYEYACRALEFSSDRDNIGGVSLYTHKFDVFRRVPFEPAEDGYDNWYLQLASSWGQAWTDDQWNGFRKWLDINDGRDLHGAGIPDAAAEWNEKSWLKYAIKYLCETDKVFMYPRISHTTNFSDMGEHTRKTVTDLQVTLAGKMHREYLFSSVEESGAVYDAFFDNKQIKSPDRIYSFVPMPYRLIRTYGLILRPWEMNVINNVGGEGIFVYDRSMPENKKITNKYSYVRYFFRGLNLKKIGEYVRNIWSI